jgi:phage gpG-like protein
MVGRATFRPGAKVERIEKRLDRPEAALRVVGQVLVAESTGAFRKQAFGRDKWEQRAPVNVFGILADLAKGGAPKDRRFRRRPALKDTGRLLGSIASRLVGSHVVEVGTNVPYGQVHQTGGTVESEKITQDIQKRLWDWLQKDGKRRRKDLGWLLNRKFRGKRLTTEVPARPFVGITDSARQGIRKTIGVEIMEAD